MNLTCTKKEENYDKKTIDKGIMRVDYYADMEKAFARKQASASDQYIENTYMAYSDWDALEVK